MLRESISCMPGGSWSPAPAKISSAVRSHPYTIGLLKCVPRLDEEEGTKLVPIKGLPPNLINMPPTCAFLPRCPYAIEQCRKEPWPDLRLVGNQQYIRCYVNTEEKKEVSHRRTI